MNFQPGDVVRVRTARRRDVTYRIVEITGELVRAANDRGEAIYAASSFERVEDASAAVNEGQRSSQQPRVPMPHEDDLTAAQRKTPVPAVFGDGATVVPFAGETIDSLVRRFKKATQKAGVLADLHRHEYYDKPSVRRKLKSAKARARCAKLEAA